MYVPLWIATTTGLLALLGSVFASIVLFKNNNKNAGITEAANLRDDQRELIDTLKENTASYQDLLAKYAESITNEAKTQQELVSIRAELARLRADFVAMQADRDELLKKSACVPLLEEQLKDRDKTIKQQVQTIKQQVGQIADLHDKLDTATVLLDAATRGQERVEGANQQAERHLLQLSQNLSAPGSSE